MVGHTVSIGRERWDLRVGLVQEDDFDGRAFPSARCLARCIPIRLACLRCWYVSSVVPMGYGVETTPERSSLARAAES
jgi:hypothetical protein